MSWILIISKGRSGYWNDKLLLPAQKPPGTLTKALPARRLQARTLCLGSTWVWSKTLEFSCTHPIPAHGHQLLSLWTKSILSVHKNCLKTRNPLTHLNSAGILGMLRRARIAACSLPAILGDFLLLVCVFRGKVQQPKGCWLRSKAEIRPLWQIPEYLWLQIFLPFLSPAELSLALTGAFVKVYHRILSHTIQKSIFGLIFRCSGWHPAHLAEQCTFQQRQSHN